MPLRFQVPPNWPAPPAGWSPPPGWQPDPAWGPAPAEWVFWVDDVEKLAMDSSQLETPQTAGTTPSVGQLRPNSPTVLPGTTPPSHAAPASPSRPSSAPIFGARKQARHLAGALEDASAALSQARNENAQLREQISRLGALDVLELEHRRRDLERQIIERRQTVDDEIAELRAKMQSEKDAGTEAIAKLASKLKELNAAVVETRESAILQELGVYEYQHPLEDAVAYKGELARLRDRIKTMNLKDGGAVSGSTNWTVNGSVTQGRAMMRETSKLMLRAYNAEADNLVRGLKPYKLAAATERLNRVALTIEKLGKTMNIRISAAYHRLRVQELGMTADFLEKLAEEKEREREEKARLREERKVQEEIERERARLVKEQQHYLNALAALEAKGDIKAVQRIQGQLLDLDRAIQDVDYRAANIRAGYVYVISNVGAFGSGVVKIGMTRRLEPQDRVRELGDASVPFKFDVHAVHFSDDAVGIESSLHAHFADRRLNQVNLRREFFYATPAEVRDELLQLAGDLLTFEEVPEAIEFHQSQAVRQRAIGVGTGRSLT